MTCAMLPLSSTDSRGPSPSTCGRRPSVISQPGRPPVALTRLPPLSSLSLPGSPSAPSLSSFILDTGAGSPPLPPPIPPLLHPQPVRPVKVEHSPLLAGPSSPSLAQDSTRVAPADVYAHAYRLLRERWAGAGSEVKEAAEQAKEVLRAQEERKRRASLEQDEEEQERSAKRVKHRRASGMVAPVAEQVEFFDNAPPSLSSSTTTALDSAVNLVGIPRTTSLPPFATVFATELALLPQATTASPRTSPTLLKRKRSVSMPPPPLTVPAYARHPRTSLPSVTEPKPASTSLPPLSSVVPLVPLATLPTSRSLPSFPTPSSARSQALSQVVNLFEAARASRAEGFRRFGEGVEERRRKSMEGGSPRLPLVFERWQ